MDEAVEWLKRAPFKGTSVELRRVAEAADFEGQIPQEIIDAEQRLREPDRSAGLALDPVAASVGADAGAARRTVEAVWRIESARLIAGLARLTGDVGLAEDLAQDALVAALEQWPSTGVPDNPGAWLTAVARRRYIDGVRRQASLRAQGRRDRPGARGGGEPHGRDRVRRRTSRTTCCG